MVALQQLGPEWVHATFDDGAMVKVKLRVPYAGLRILDTHFRAVVEAAALACRRHRQQCGADCGVELWGSLLAPQPGCGATAAALFVCSRRSVERLPLPAHGLATEPWARIYFLRETAGFYPRFDVDTALYPVARDVRAAAIAGRRWHLRSVPFAESQYRGVVLADPSGDVAVWVTAVSGRDTAASAIHREYGQRSPVVEEFPSDARLDEVPRALPPSIGLSLAWLRAAHAELWGRVPTERDQILLAWPNTQFAPTPQLVRAPVDVLLAVRALLDAGEHDVARALFRRAAVEEGQRGYPRDDLLVAGCVPSVVAPRPTVRSQVRSAGWFAD